jgi:hypothetical protein
VGAHDRDAGTLEQLHALCDAIKTGRAPLPKELEPGSLLGELRRELLEHVAAEESEAHFATIARVRPELLPLVVDLKADHAALLGALTRIERIANAANQWDELGASISNFIAASRAHEQAETELMQLFLTQKQEAAEHLA